MKYLKIVSGRKFRHDFYVLQKRILFLKLIRYNKLRKLKMAKK